MSNQKRKYEQKARAEAHAATRERIAVAAASLHAEVGIARTTVADIARKAGVQRVTVYNHFPDLAALLPACSAHWLAEHPMPDLGPALAERDPERRLRTALAALYGWYRANQRMQEHARGERATVPELDAYMARSADVAMSGLADALAGGLQRPLVALALDFWTWRRLALEGLDDDAAAAAMARAAASPAAS